MHGNRILYSATLLLLAALATGCSPLRKGASSQGFYSGGRTDINITVAKPLTLASTGELWASVPVDVSNSPRGSFTYAAFTEGQSGPVTRHAHTIISSLPRNAWRWEMETWALPEALLYSKMKAAGKNWTVQILPVTSATDWFSGLWKSNNRQVPEFWLAKRWSSTPTEQTRIVAEYREPAPACMRRALADNAARPMGTPPLSGKELWRGCEKEIEDFSARSEAVFLLDTMQQQPDTPPAATLPSRPESLPDMGKLVGRAEPINHDKPFFKD